MRLQTGDSFNICFDKLMGPDLIAICGSEIEFPILSQIPIELVFEVFCCLGHDISFWQRQNEHRGH